MFCSLASLAPNFDTKCVRKCVYGAKGKPVMENLSSEMNLGLR